VGVALFSFVLGFYESLDVPRIQANRNLTTI
jgi:hypothetical protein